MNTRNLTVLALLGALLGPGGTDAAASSTEASGQYLDDATITAKVKAALAGDKWVKGRDIHVRTDNRVVDLTGTVNSKEESDRAADLATIISSVRAVHNKLTVTAR